MLSDPNSRRRARVRRLVPLFAAAMTVFLVASCSSTPKPASSTTSAAPSSSVASSSSPASSSPAVDPNAKKVEVSSLEADGATFGVGMPIVLYFKPAPTDITEFNKVVTVTVNGQKVNGGWYWEKPYKDQPVQAHYRMRSYWPAHATIKVNLPIGGLSAGKGLVFGNQLTSVTFQTGDAHISTVNATTLKMTVQDNGKTVKTIPVSLGAAKTPTYNGTKVVMQKGEDVPGTSTLRPDGEVRMVGPGYDELVKWSVRVTASGEYVHAAPWNSRIGQVSTSNGCTNLSTADAEWFYKFSLVGDVVTYTGTDGTKVPSWDGFGDWNVPWGLWMTGGPDQP